MTRKKSLLVAMVFILMLSMFAAACSKATDSGEESASSSSSNSSSNSSNSSNSSSSANSSSGSEDPFGKFEPAITVSLSDMHNPGWLFEDGDDYTNNIWTRAYEEELGIKFTYLWQASEEQFNERLNVAIASDDLPDIIQVPYSHFYQLAKAGKLLDLTEAYDKYASPLLKELTSMNDSFRLKTTTVDGKLQGLTNVPDLQPSYFLSVRDDWLSNLNLSPPKTVDDVLNIARAFTHQDPDGNGADDTVGLAMDQNLWLGGVDLSGLANGYGAYPKIWVEKDGQLAYGSVQPEMKLVLGALQGLYSEGALNKEFALLDTWGAALDEVRAGRAGMSYAPNWWPLNAPGDVIKENPAATWSFYPIVTTDGQTALSQVSAKPNWVMAATTSLSNPEALIKMANLAAEKLHDPEKSDGAFHSKDGVLNFFHAKIRLALPDPAFQNWKNSVAVADALASGDTSKLNGEQQGYYDSAILWHENQDPAGWPLYAVFGPDSTMMLQKDLADAGLYYLDRYTGPDTPTMMTNKANLDQRETEVFTRIIMGANLDQEFDEWVQYFNAQGGAQITSEVNEWWAAQ